MATTLEPDPETPKGARVRPAAQSQWASVRAPFVGRAREVELFARALGEVQQGRGAAFAVVGEAGIGKTRLAGEIVGLAQAAGIRVAIACCTDVDGAPALWPWIEILRALARERGGLPSAAMRSGLEELYSLVSELGIAVPPVPAVGDEAQFALLDAVARGIHRVADDEPLLLLLDDLHQADTDSILLLRELALRCAHHPLMLIGTHRDDGVAARRRSALADYERAAHRIALTGLEAEGAARLVAWAAGREPTARRMRQLLERSGGNPLFLTELAEALDDAPLPRSVRHALAPRLAALSDELRSLLGYAAVLGQQLEIDTLCELVGPTPAERLEALETLIERGFLVRRADGECAFAHPLIHEVAYEEVPPAERASTHRRIADLLAGAGRDATEAEKARLAHHLAQTDAPECLALAVAHAAGAAALAREGLALHRAADHLALALRAQRRLRPFSDARRRQRLELLLALGQVQSLVGARAEARDTYTEATELARAVGDAGALGKAAAGWVGFEEAPLEFTPEALARIEEALGALEGSDAPERADLLSLFAHFLWFWRRFDRCEPVAREALACAERQDEPLHRVHAMVALHRALSAPEDLPERLELARGAVALAAAHAPRHFEATARRHLAMGLLQRGDVAEGRQQLLHVTRIWVDLRRPVDAWSVAALRATVALLDGDFDAAERLVTDVLRLGMQVESRVAPAIFVVQLYRLREHQGRLDEVVELLRARVEALPAVPALGWLLRLALMRLDRRDELRASFERVAARGFDELERDENFEAVLCAAAQIAHFLQDGERAARIHALLLPYEGLHVVVGYGHYWAGAVARYLALLEATLDRPEAEAHFDQAIASHRRAGTPALLAETLTESAAWLAAHGEAPRAREQLAEALGLYRALGLETFASAVATSLEALDVTNAAEPGADDGDGAAADRVVRLVREGGRWRIEYAGSAAFVDDRKGMDDLALLVASPGRELHVLDLMERAPLATHAAEPGLRVGTGPVDEPRLDARARAAYRARRAELQARLEEAELCNDAAARTSLREEIAWLESELRGALRGGDGPVFVQRARKAVYNRIQAAIRAIERVHPELGRHLRHGVRTGEVCRYAPEQPLRWQLATERQGDPAGRPEDA